MNNTKKRKSKLRIKKLVLCIGACLGILILIIWGVAKSINYLSTRPSTETGRPLYYLFIGTDEKAANEADTVLLLSRNDKKQEAVCISIPSNTQIVSRQEGKTMLLRQTFVEGGSEETRSAIENLLHIRIDKYAVINFSDFKNYVSQVGPVSMYVEKSMEHNDKNGMMDIAIHQGYQPLQEDSALGYVRYIDTENGELGRLQRQERFMKVVLGNMQQHSALYNWAMAHHYWNAMETDITPEDAGKLAYHMTNYPMENCKFIIFPGETQKKGNTESWVINPVEAQKVIALTMQ